MGEETTSSPTTTAITSRGGGPTRASTEEASPGSPSSPQQKPRRSTETTTSGPLHTPNVLPSPPPASTSTSVIPFSWEEHPGVPKATGTKPPSPPSKQPADSPSPAAKLPLPPPLRPGRPSDGALSRIKKRPGARAGDCRHADPFAVALVTCSRGDANVADLMQTVDDAGESGGRCGIKAAAAGVDHVAPSAGKLVGYGWRRGTWRWGVVGDRFGMASCMPAAAATGAVMDSTVRLPRRSLPTAATPDDLSFGLPTRQLAHPPIRPR